MRKSIKEVLPPLSPSSSDEEFSCIASLLEKTGAFIYDRWDGDWMFFAYRIDKKTICKLDLLTRNPYIINENPLILGVDADREPPSQYIRKQIFRSNADYSWIEEKLRLLGL